MRFIPLLAMEDKKKVEFWRKVLSGTNYTNKTKGATCLRHYEQFSLILVKLEDLEKLVIQQRGHYSGMHFH